MQDIVIKETMYDMDKSRDGKITLKEYISKHLSLSLSCNYGIPCKTKISNENIKFI